MKVVDFNILLENIESLNKLYSSTLTIPAYGTIEMAYARVVSVGEGRVNKKTGTKVPVKVNVGDLVVYNPGVGIPVEYTIKNADGTTTKVKRIKVKSTECILSLAEDAEGNVTGIKDVKENYVVVRRSEKDKISMGGIIFPEINRTIDNISGTVYMVGPGKYNPESDKVEPCMVDVGDKVSFCEIGAIKLTLPVTDEKGNKKNETFYEIPDSVIDFVYDNNNEGAMKKIKKGHVLVKRSEAVRKTASGIYLAETDSEGHLVSGEITMVGEGVEHAKVGDRIAYVDAKEENKQFKVKTEKGISEKRYMIPETAIDAWLEPDEEI